MNVAYYLYIIFQCLFVSFFSNANLRMKQLLIIVATISLIATSCTKRENVQKKFTEKEVTQLKLDSTKKIIVNNKKSINIDLNPFLNEGSYNFGEMIKSINLIFLESTDESILSNIKDIVVTETNIYILDDYMGDGIAIFKKNGEFIKRIKKGQGPDEILPNVKKIAYDCENDKLIVFHNHFFSFFTKDGEYVMRKMVPLNGYSFAITPNGYLFHSINCLNNTHISNEKEYQILITDKSFKLLSVGFPYEYTKDNIYEGLNRYINSNRQNINFTFKFTNDIYKYTNDYNVDLKYRLNISSKEIPTKLLNEKYEVLMSNLNENNYFFFMGDYVENNTHDYFRLMNLHSRHYTYIYRNKHNGKCIGGVNRIIDRSSFIPLNEPISTYKNYFVSYSYPTDEYIKLLTAKVFSKATVKKIKSMTTDSNPVILLYDLKDFQ